MVKVCLALEPPATYRLRSEKQPREKVEKEPTKRRKTCQGNEGRRQTKGMQKLSDDERGDRNMVGSP